MVTNKYQFPKITEQMHKELAEWYKTHNQGKCASRRYHGAIGGNITFKITPTSIGNFIEAECICGDWIKLGEEI